MSLSVSLLLAGVLAAAPESDRPPHFETEIIPVLTKAGCNAGSCHGSAAGRGGFQLSLWGSDPSADYAELVEEYEGRRVNLVDPEESLVLRKPTGLTGHEGGIPLPLESAGADRLRRWIAAGAPFGPDRPLESFDVSPLTQVVKRGEPVPLRAHAAFAKESSQDVTNWTVWKPTDASAVTIDPKTTIATVHRPGQHVIIARFLDRVVPIQLLVPYGDEPVDLAQEPRGNFIDEFVDRRLEDLSLPPSPRTDASEFLRRVSLDLTGRLPDPETVTAYLRLETQLPEDISIHRQKLVEDLLNSDEFVEYWTFRLGELLRIGGNRGGIDRAIVFEAWLEKQIRGRTPMDEIARELITANGDPLEYGPANFYLVAGDARGQAEYVSQAFLGVRLRCANCHNHPLDRWTQDDYHGFAAVFARVDRGKEIKQKSFGNVIHPKTGEPAIPRIPGAKYLENTGDLRLPVAEWLTSEENAYFSTAIVNRLWKEMMGRGLVDPTDDLSETNPATHPELLEKLAADFVEHGFDIRHTLRRIALSQTYQRQSAPTGINRLDDRFYSHMPARPLSAEVLMDAWGDVTGVSERFPDAEPGTRAISLVSPQIESRSLDVLGRCDRGGDCETGSAAGTTGSLAAKLHVLNGSVLNEKLRSKNGRLQAMIQSKKSDETILEELYLRALSRPPNEKEKAFWLKQFTEAKSNETRRAVFEDFLWSLLTCQEFRANH